MTDTLVPENPNVVAEVPEGDAGTLTVAADPSGRRPTIRGRVRGLDYRWVALSVVLCGTVMSILDATVVNVAIRTLQQAFNTGSYSDIAWVVTAYSLAQGAVIPITGWATDRFGTKRLYVISLFLFTGASALCGAAPTLPTLVLFRILQGVGGGMLMPIGMTVILRAFGPAQMGRVMGYFGIPMLIAPALGPVLGGWFSQDFSWRLIFYINVPIGALAIAAAVLFLRESETSRSFRLDLIGLLTATPGVVALMYAMSRSSTDGWGSPVVLVLLAASVVLLGAFVARQLTAEHPLLHLQLFKDPTFSWSIVLGFVLITAFFGSVFLLPSFLQTVHGYGPLETGLLLLPQAVIAAFLMPVGGKLADRIGPKPVVMVGLAFLAVSGFFLATVTARTSILTIIVVMLLRGVAMAFAMMPGMSAGLARIPPQLVSRASSITNTAQRVGQSVGIALLVTFLSAQAAPAARAATCAPSPIVLVEAAQVHHLSHVPTATSLCDSLAAGASASSADGVGSGSATGFTDSGHPEYDAFITAYADDAISGAFDRTFLLVAVLSVLGIIPAWFLRRPDRPSAGLALRAPALAD